MTIFLVGLNHRTAPVELRETLHLSSEQCIDLMDVLQSECGYAEVVILSTCNRIEIYLVTLDSRANILEIVDTLESYCQLEKGKLAGHIYLLKDLDAANHLMRVSSGLDSMVLGETQILGQVSDSHRLAQKVRASGLILNRLFEMAIHTGKRAHTETTIGEYTTSISHAAVLLALSSVENPTDMRALVVGAGNMATLAVEALCGKGVVNIDVVNRTQAHAEQLAQQTAGRAYGWHELHEALAQADIVISATSAPHTVIHLPDVERAMTLRDGRKQVLIDTAVPRDVDQDVVMLPHVMYYNIDDLQQVVDENYARRQSSIPAVGVIIDEELTKFRWWLRGREVVPAIKDLREKVQAIADAEVEHVLKQLPEEEHAIVTKMVHRIVNKVLHEPTVRLRAQAALEEDINYVSAIRELFALNGEERLG